MLVTGCVTKTVQSANAVPYVPRKLRDLGIAKSMHGRNRGICLHHVIFRGARHSILVRTVVYHRSYTAKIIVRRRSGCRPLQRRRFPWIVAGLLAFEDA